MLRRAQRRPLGDLQVAGPSWQNITVEAPEQRAACIPVAVGPAFPSPQLEQQAAEWLAERDEYTASRRSSETPEQPTQRPAQRAEYMARARASETPQHAAQRRAQNAEQMAVARAALSPEAAAARRAQDAQRVAEARAALSPEAAAVRRAQNAQNMAEAYLRQTPEQLVHRRLTRNLQYQIDNPAAYGNDDFQAQPQPAAAPADPAVVDATLHRLRNARTARELFAAKMACYRFHTCPNCKRRTMTAKSVRAWRCAKGCDRFTAENDMDPG